MSQIPYDIYHSRSKACKEPFGAVRAHTEIRFSIYPARKDAVMQPVLWICTDGEETSIAYPLQWQTLIGDREQFSVTVTMAQSGLYWYYFSLTLQDQSQYVSQGVRGHGVLGTDIDARFQLTVYEALQGETSWYGAGITYQIFPDRFYRGDHFAPKQMQGRWVHEKWEESPVYAPDANGEILNNDFFGGTLQGIAQKLPYLQSLGVSTIYLNPVFEAASNHRYDTADYYSIDPYLGTEEDFKNLCTAAREKGIRILLDGVFSHTGFDSRYFNGKGTYDNVGAYQSQQSPYASWYEFTKWPNEYAAWWGIYTLPQVNELDVAYLDFIAKKRDSVVRHWLELGASGWRLDVADELPDAFIETLTTAAKETKEDAVIIGEVWEDASCKIAYSERRKYFLGRELDSVMNYPLRNAIIAFVRGGDAADFVNAIESLQENYPRHVFYNLMNLVGTHDTERILTMLEATQEELEALPEVQAATHFHGARLYRAKQRLYMAVCLQFGMPGSPTIYYGDEIGMQGFRDPHCRRTYAWGKEDSEVQKFYRKICAVRQSATALQRGDFIFEHTEGAVLGFWRKDARQRIYVVVNRSENVQEIQLDASFAIDLLSDREYKRETQHDFMRISLAGLSAYMIQC